MADPVRMWGQALLRAWKTGYRASERADGQGAASPRAVAIAVWLSDLTLRLPRSSECPQSIPESHFAEDPPVISICLLFRQSHS
jgi:hypothetical protein